MVGTLAHHFTHSERLTDANCVSRAGHWEHYQCSIWASHLHLLNELLRSRHRNHRYNVKDQRTDPNGSNTQLCLCWNGAISGSNLPIRGCACPCAWLHGWILSTQLGCKYFCAVCAISSTVVDSRKLGGLVINGICKRTSTMATNAAWQIPFGLFYVVPTIVACLILFIPEVCLNSWSNPVDHI